MLSGIDELPKTRKLTNKLHFLLDVMECEMSTLYDLVAIESFESLMEKEGHMMNVLDFVSVKDIRLHFRSIIMAHMKMEDKKLNIDLKLLYVNEQEIYMSPCLLKYNQSTFLARHDHAETTEESAGDVGCSLPRLIRRKSLLQRGTFWRS